MKTEQSKEFKRTAKTALVFTLACVMGISCLTGCGGTSKPNNQKPATNQSQQVKPEDTQKPSTAKPESQKPADKQKPGVDKKEDKKPAEQQQKPTTDKKEDKKPAEQQQKPSSGIKKDNKTPSANNSQGSKTPVKPSSGTKK